MNMNAALAASLVGGPKQVIANQAKALAMHSWLNTPDDTARLEAAQWALKNWKKFQAAKRAQIEARHSRR